MALTPIECPHCYSRVVLMENGSCPACGKMPSAQGADASKTPFSVFEGMNLPGLCFHCGTPTNDKVTVKKRTQANGGMVGLVLGIFKHVLGLLVFRASYLLRAEDERERHPALRLKVSIPFCQDCRGKYGIPEAHSVDFERGRIAFLVDKEIADRLAQRS